MIILYFTFLFSLFVFVSAAGQYNVIWTGTGLPRFRFGSRTVPALLFLIKYNIANSSCHFGSYGSIWTIWPSVPWIICYISPLWFILNNIIYIIFLGTKFSHKRMYQLHRPIWKRLYPSRRKHNASWYVPEMKCTKFKLTTNWLPCKTIWTNMLIKCM